MRGIPKLITTIGLFGLALLPTIAAVPPEPPASSHDARMPVAIAQPLGAIKRGAILDTAAVNERRILTEPGMLVLVGSALLGLAAVVRRTT